MNQPHTQGPAARPAARPILTVATRRVVQELDPVQMLEAIAQLRSAMRTPDPENPNLWTIHVGGHRLWGILDEGAGPAGEDLLTILFPSDY